MVIRIDKYREYLSCSDELFYSQLVGCDLSLESVSEISSGESPIGIIRRDGTMINTEFYKKLDSVDGVFTLKPGTYSFTFEQGIELDSSHYAEIVPRSSLVRCGGVIGAGIYEPGYKVDRIGAVIHLTNTLIIEKGARVVQLKIYEGYDFGTYSGQWSKNDIK